MGGTVTLPWKGRAILLVDLDAFFASVEQLDHPEWRGKPVIVGGDADRRGVVSTCSYEARAYGVRSAMASSMARRLCPDAIWTRGNFRRYTEMSNQVMDILLDESPYLQQVSIDEAFLDVTAGRFTGDHPVLVAERIRSRVAMLGITCSVGLGTSKTIAKIASDMDKPNGITVVYPGCEESFLSPLPVRSISGIGRKTAERLHLLGITTLGQLSDLDDTTAHELFGINADSMRARCRGIDPDEVEVEREVKSVSNEMTFSTDIRERDEIEQSVRMLSAKVGRRLRRKGLIGHVAILKMKYADLSIRTARKPLTCSCDDESMFSDVLIGLIDELWETGVSVRLIGVGIGDLSQRGEGSPHVEQLGLFDVDDSAGAMDETARRGLIDATDKVKNRFGDDAVSYGRDLRFKDRGTGTAPQRKDEF